MKSQVILHQYLQLKIVLIEKDKSACFSFSYGGQVSRSHKAGSLDLVFSPKIYITHTVGAFSNDALNSTKTTRTFFTP